MSTWITNQLTTDVALLTDRPRVSAPYAAMAATKHMSAPKTAVQGITVPFAGQVAADSVLAAVVTDAGNPGSTLREAPV